MTDDVVLRGLNPIDMRVLRAACEAAIEQEHLTAINARELKARDDLRDLSDKDVIDSAQLLEELGYFDCAARPLGGGLNFAINVADRGFEQYMWVYRPGDETRRVKEQVVNMGEGEARALSEAVGCPLLVATHVLRVLAARNQVKVMELNSRLNLYFHEPSVSLRREVQGA